jgi:hypothetical protein
VYELWKRKLGVFWIPGAPYIHYHHGSIYPKMPFSWRKSGAQLSRFSTLSKYFEGKNDVLWILIGVSMDFLL